MKQRTFPWIQSLSAPTDAPRATVAQCTGYGMAVRVALEMKPGGPWSDAWLAGRLGVNRGYFSRLLNGKQGKPGEDKFPEWMLRPIAFATGSRLVEQYHALQQALAAGDDTRALIRQIARQAMATQHPERRAVARAA